jgi:NADPH-dependent 2,4-dienoyl-CoA reductase/sulfur reductase-like enzyme
MASDPIVVVGGGLAAARLAIEYRAADGDAGMTILSAEPDPPYNRPPLTKGFLRGEMDSKRANRKTNAHLKVFGEIQVAS